MVDHALMPGAGAYYLDGSRDHCVVLVHGYTATPGELRLLGDELQQLNFKVMGVRLPGHGTTVQDLAKQLSGIGVMRWKAISKEPEDWRIRSR